MLLSYLQVIENQQTGSSGKVFHLFFQAGIFQEDLYPMTAGNQAAMTAQEWLLGVNRGLKEARQGHYKYLLCES